MCVSVKENIVRFGIVVGDSDRQFSGIDLPAESAAEISVPSDQFDLRFGVLCPSERVALDHVKESAKTVGSVMEMRDALHKLTCVKVLQLAVELAKRLAGYAAYLGISLR